jgi:CheY-like chemotaxis protein
MITRTNTSTPMAVAPAPQQVVVVSNHPQMNDVLQTVLDAGHYDVVFVESTDHAYSHIKRVAPHLIIVCLEIDDLEGFQVLSMLKLDSVTRSIPVVTCTVTQDIGIADDAAESGEAVFTRSTSAYMH